MFNVLAALTRKESEREMVLDEVLAEWARDTAQRAAFMAHRLNRPAEILLDEDIVHVDP